MLEDSAMPQKFRRAIEENYGVSIVSCDIAPRGAIAETFIINGFYFCKLVSNPVIVKYLKNSLLLLDCLTRAGIERVNGLIKPFHGLSVTVEDTEIVLTKLLQGKQSRDYHLPSFGALLASIHDVNTDAISSSVAGGEDFDISFVQPVIDILHAEPSCEAHERVREVLKRHGEDLLKHIDAFRRISEWCQKEPVAYVITHGDVQGNVLMKERDDLYIIDWDEAVLAPRERDLWFFEDNPEFMKGYGQTYTLNKKMLYFFTFKAYFVNMLLRIEAVRQGQGDAEAMSKICEQLEWRISPQGWMRPKLDAIIGEMGA